MKKTLLALALCMLCTMTQAQDNNKDVEAFLAKYQTLVENVEKKDSISQADYTKFRAQYNNLSTEYHGTYKSQMNNDQLARYMELRTRYHKRFMREKAGKTGEQIDTIAAKVADGMKRTGSKVGGFFKGVFSGKK